ncbi:MAG: hypothetical protein WCI73_13535, partial [Phycisphaerae bacterium]
MGTRQTWVVILAGLLTFAASAAALGAAEEENGKSEAGATAEQLQQIEAVRPALVQVEYTVQFDKGESPRGNGYSERCPNCGQYHGSSLDEYIKEERPMKVPGYLIGANRVLTSDLQIHPRFIKAITVRLGDQTVTAKPESFARDTN